MTATASAPGSTTAGGEADGADPAEPADGRSTDDAADGTTTEVNPRVAFDTKRWQGLTGVALLLVAVGVITRQPGPVLAGALGIGYGVFVRWGDAPVAELDVERRLDEQSPEPGEEVTVTVTVTNVGDAFRPDLRLVDGVPDGLAVVDGPARFATALRPGASATFSYVVRAARGDHEWGPLRAITRNPSGARERETTLTRATQLTCAPAPPAAADLPLRGLTTQYHGRVPTDVGGSGVEFHATREYRHGDPLRRVDWNRRARTGELATLELREERAATVVLLIDAREDAYAAPEPEADHAVDASVEAAGQAFAALREAGDRVGIATLGPVDCWLPPGAGTDHGVRGRDLLATHPALAPTPPSDGFYPSLWFRRFRRRLPADAQVLFFTPAVDDYAASIARRVDAHGHLVTVVSPDVTADDTPGRTLVRHERRERLRRLRGSGIRVVEWGDRSFPVAVAGARRRWSP
ncbi:DUF58 domain-containing protein [Halorubrum gandharaense]